METLGHSILVSGSISFNLPPYTEREKPSEMLHYNHEISRRFYYLGVHDWAYKANPNNPLLTESRFGKKEKAVDIKYAPKG